MESSANPGATSLPLDVLRSALHACPYLPGQTAENEFLLARHLDAAAYQSLMDQRFRRSGHLIYRPVCKDCRECVPLRVPVERFAPSRSQRRVLRRNVDVHLEIGRPRCDEEKQRIFAAYLADQHDQAEPADREELEAFLYQSPTDTLEMVYRVQERIVAVGMVDRCPASLSSVYFFFDPAERRRSLGVLGALCEIGQCAKWGLPYWYVGYYVKDCRQMNYKAAYRPFELLGEDGVWRPAPARDRSCDGA